MSWRLLHVITGFEPGGAERSLARLVGRLDRDRFEVAVVGLGPEGPVAEELRRSGVETTALSVSGPLGAVGGALRLIRSARRRRPDLVHGWMYHGDLGAALAASVVTLRRRPLVWGIRQGLYDYATSPWTTRLAIRTCAALSPLPDRILYNAREAARQHESAGFRNAGSRVLPNGYDVDAYAGAPGARERIRSDLGIGAEAEVVGMLARWHPVKNHAGFLAAAARLAARRPGARFLLCGPGVDRSNADLVRVLAASPVTERVHLLGARGDVPDLLQALDVATLSSHGEAFPNSLAEAMAAGVPCVATDVGDVADLIGDTGVIVPPADPEALAAGWETLLSLDAGRRRELRVSARERIRSRFGLDAAVAALEAVYAELLSPGPGSGDGGGEARRKTN